MYVWQYNDWNIEGMDEQALEDYLQIGENSTPVELIYKANPNYHYTIPYVTDHRYYIRFGYGLDMTSTKLEIQPYLWQDSHKSIELVMNFV